MEDILNTEGMAEKWEENCKKTKVLTVDDAQVGIMKSDPPQISITAEGTVRTTGWGKAHLEAHIYVHPPPDGIYGFEFLGDTARRSVGRCDHADQIGRIHGGNARRLSKAFGFTPKQTKWNFSQPSRTTINRAEITHS